MGSHPSPKFAVGVRIDPLCTRQGRGSECHRLRPWLMVVPPVGLEPTPLSGPDFESGASTNFTTGAADAGYTGSPRSRNLRQFRSP